jgi:putative NADH-flavin reductase
MQKWLSICCFSVLTLALLAGAGLMTADAKPASLRILIYGASGKLGKHVVDEALSRGHLVTAVTRDPSRITRTHPNLSVVKGNILDSENVASLLAGQDVVIISVRGVVGKSKDPDDTVARIGLENVVNALRTTGGNTARLIHVGGSGSLEVSPGKLYADTLPKAFMPKSLEVEIAGQISALEFLRSVKDVDWSYATPAKNFTNGKRTGVFRIGGNQLLKDSRGRSRISRADFAVALVDEAENAEHSRQRFSVAY